MKYRVRIISSRGKKYVKVVNDKRRVKKSFGRKNLEAIAQACVYCASLNGLIQFFEKAMDETEEDVKMMSFCYFGGVLSLKDIGEEYEASKDE